MLLQADRARPGSPRPQPVDLSALAVALGPVRVRVTPSVRGQSVRVLASCAVEILPVSGTQSVATDALVLGHGFVPTADWARTVLRPPLAPTDWFVHRPALGFEQCQGGRIDVGEAQPPLLYRRGSSGALLTGGVTVELFRFSLCYERRLIGAWGVA